MMWKAALGTIAAAAIVVPAAAAEKVIPPAVPANLAVAPAYEPFAITRAEGTQNYICMPSAGGATWAFIGPQATLFGERGEQTMTHFLSANPAQAGALRPTWQHSRDSSAVWAEPIASSTDPAFVQAGAVPWLLLRIVGFQYGPAWGDRLARTAFIQRVNTEGGVPPAEGCGTAGDVGKRALVPYTTEYVFYR